MMTWMNAAGSIGEGASQMPPIKLNRLGFVNDVFLEGDGGHPTIFEIL
jgi:hypothetical protein